MITVFAMCLFLAQPTVDEVRAAAETLFADKTAGDVVWNKGEVQVSPLGFHVRYQRQYQGVPIVDRQPRKVHFDSHLSKVYAHADAPAVAKFPGFGRLSTEAVQDALSKLNAEPGAEQPPKKAFKKKPEVDPEKDWRVTGTSRFYLVTRQAVLAIVRLEVSSADDQEQYWLDLDSGTGQVVNRFNRTLNHQAPAAIQQKTEGRGTIWRHNPVAAAATPGDPSSKQVSVPLRGLDGSGYLRGAYVDVTVPSPVVPAQYQSRHWLHYKPGQALEPSFTYDYDPSDPRFEEVSAYYWMDRAQRYLQAQGHHLREEPIGVAVHYAAGTNAGYMIGRNMIYFMDGLVDTAEDADVVRHEYGHAVLDAACGPRLYDYYGAMFHEGFADFFSYMIAQDAEAEVGPDRYPEFMGEWIGRGRNSQPSYLRTFHKPVFSYPFLTYRPHTDGTLWSSLFYELSLSLGLENTSDLLLETLYRLDSAEPAEVSARLLEVETLLFAGTHRAQLEKSLKDRGLYQPETTMNITELGMGAQSFPVDGKLRYFRFQAPAGGGDLHIQIKSSTGGFVGAFMGKAFLPDAYTYDIYHPSYDTNNVSWVLRADGLSHPRLEPGSWYMIGVMANWGRSYEISLETVTADPIPSWLDGAPLQFELRPFESRTFHLGELAGVTEIALQSSAELVYTTISQSLPKTTQHPADGTSQGSYVSSTTYWGQNLRGMDPLEDKFLTVFNPFYEPQSLTFSWETTTTSFIQTLALNTPQTRVLGKSYQNVWQLDLTEDADQLNFITEAQHAFFVLPIQPGQFIFPAFSTLQNGKHTVSANPNQPFVSTLESLSEVGAGTYYAYSD